MIRVISTVCDSIDSCCDSFDRCADSMFNELIHLIKNIQNAVANFFNDLCSKIAGCLEGFFCCAPVPEDEDPLHWNAAGADRLINWRVYGANLEQFRDTFRINRGRVYGPNLEQLRDTLRINRGQVYGVNLEELREILRTNGLDPIHISDQFSAADFTALCQDYPISVWIAKADGTVLREVQVQKIDDAQNMLHEIKQQIRRDEGDEVARNVQSRFNFPPERIRIGEWATRWAKRRDIKIDEGHPYFEIFQAAFQYKNQISGGLHMSDLPHFYTVYDEGYLNGSLFRYIIKSLIGFQELSREENRELMRLLDNHKSTFAENFAYKFARALSKIYCYPTAAAHNVMDVYDKLQIGIGAPMEAFRAAQEHNKVLEYFQTAFQNRNCFDYRVSEFTQFIFRLNNPNAEDFIPNVAQGDPLDRKIPEYFRIFKNEQIMKMARDQRLNYGDLKENVNLGVNIPDTQNFYQNYCTKDRFAEYLVENHHPLKDLVEVDGEVTLIPEQPDWAGKVPHGIKRVPNHLIPEEHREVGRVLGVKDPGVYLATVERDRRPGFDFKYRLVFSKRPPAAWQADLPIIPFETHWNGLNDAEINPDILPLNKRISGSQILIRDPAVYQVKVHALEVESVTLDFRGEPIPRERWEAILTQDYWEA